jgi:hypothetical protein
VSPYDVTPDDDPLDLAAVGADDALVEGLRRSLSPDAAVVWDDDDDDLDPAFAMLRALQRDVSADLPAGDALPANVTPLVTRRRLGRGATVAALVAGVVSIGGVAAASAPGQPLAGMRSAVTSAVGNVVSAMTPDTSAGRSHAEPSKAAGATSTPTPRHTAASPGPAVGTAGRSSAAVEQVTAALDRASRLLDRGQYSAASNQLDVAGRKLPLVTDSATHDRLAARLAALRARLAGAQPTATTQSGSSSDQSSVEPGDNSSHEQSGKQSDKQSAEPDSKATGEADHNGSGKSGGEDNGKKGKPTARPSHDVSGPSGVGRSGADDAGDVEATHGPKAPHAEPTAGADS